MEDKDREDVEGHMIEADRAVEADRAWEGDDVEGHMMEADRAVEADRAFEGDQAFEGD